MTLIDNDRIAGRMRRRKAGDLVFRAYSLLTAFVGISALVWILIVLIGLGVSGLSIDLFTQSTPPPNEAGGGLANAIVGSLMIVGVAILFAAPIGVMAGTYLAEYGDRSAVAATVRFVNDILLSAPSILIGLFVYSILVAPLGGYSGWAGSVALALIAIPIIVRTTEDMLRLVPNTLREAGVAMGAPRSYVIRTIAFRAVRAGILTGVILALARIAGETAPLLFTALNNQFWTTDMTGPVANLPVTIYNMAGSPYEQWRSLAWAGAFVITVAILALSVLARALLGTDKGLR